MIDNKLSLYEIIENCKNNNIEYKLLSGFGVDVNKECEFVFVNRGKGIPSNKLESFGINSNYYDINTSFDSYYKGYWLTTIELKSRKYNHKPTIYTKINYPNTVTLISYKYDYPLIVDFWYDIIKNVIHDPNRPACWNKSKTHFEEWVKYNTHNWNCYFGIIDGIFMYWGTNELKKYNPKVIDLRDRGYKGTDDFYNVNRKDFKPILTREEYWTKREREINSICIATGTILIKEDLNNFYTPYVNCSD